MSQRHRCTFCGWTRNNRTYRNVGTTEYPEDEICNLCDTQEEDSGSVGDEEQESEASSAFGDQQPEQIDERLSVALRRSGKGRRLRSFEPFDRVQG